MSKYCVFSFDDGRKDQYDIAYQILKRFSFPATINIVTDFIINENLYTNFGKKSVSWNNLIEMEQDCGWEIACHGASHSNSVDDIQAWLNNPIIQKNHWNNNVGFASPESYVTEDSYPGIRSMLKNKELQYIRSGKQARREGLIYAVKTLLNRYIKSPVLFQSLNRDCIIKSNNRQVLPSVGITSHETVKEVWSLLKCLDDGDAIILMFHSIIDESYNTTEYGLWYWESSRLMELCKRLASDKSFRVITTRELCSRLRGKLLVY